MGARVRNRTGHSAVREVGSDGIGGVDGRRGRKNSGSSSYLHRLYQNSYFPNWWARMTGGSIPFTSVVHKQSPSSALADADYDEEQMEATGATSLYPHSSRKNAGASYSVVNGLDSDTVYSPVNSGSGEETTSRMASSGESQIHLTDVSHRSRSFFSGSKPAGSSSADSIGNLSPTRRERIAKGEKTKLNRSSTNNSSNTGTFTIDTPTEEAEDDVYL